MIFRTQITPWIAVITVALSLPAVIAYAQEVTDEISSSTPEVVEESAVIEVTEATSTDPIIDPGEVMGTTTDETIEPEPVATTTPSEPEPVATTTEQSSGGGAPEEETQPIPQEETTSTPEIVVSLPAEELASTTASSTEVIVPPKPVYDTRTVFIETGVEMSKIRDGKMNATITLANHTCRFCETSSPETSAEIYLTPWYENRADAIVPAEKFASKNFSVPSIKGWATTTLSWEGEAPTTPGKYYFVVVVDPENAIGAKNMYRTEIVIE